MRLTGDGFAPASPIRVEIRGEKGAYLRVSATATADSSGAFSSEFKLPEDLPAPGAALVEANVRKGAGVRAASTQSNAPACPWQAMVKNGRAAFGMRYRDKRWLRQRVGR